MSDRLKFMILTSVIALMAGIFFLLQSQDPTRDAFDRPQVLKGRPAPDFTLPNLNGEIVRLSDYRGKVVFLNIWATWCPPCREEMPAMEKLHRKMQGENFEILAVSIDAAGAEAVAPFVTKNQLNFPILLDPKGMIKGLYNVTGVPETIIVDKQGIIVSRMIGSRDWAGFKSVNSFRDLARKPPAGG